MNSSNATKSGATADRRPSDDLRTAVAMPDLVMVSSRDILRGRSSVCIDHNGTAYRLQTTRQGKLILTK